jgi:hypothetical protein
MQNGKGDTPRPVDKEKYDINYERIFRRDRNNKKKGSK